MSIGDVNSNTRGSGARYNDGKAPYDLLPLGIVLDVLYPTRGRPCNRPVFSSLDVLRHMAKWQAGDDAALVEALRATGVHGLEDLTDCAAVFDYGKKTKYKEWNWAKGMAWSVPLGCTIRHALAHLNGESIDPESGLPHRGHIQCNLLMLLTYARLYAEGDDRPTQWLGERGAKAVATPELAAMDASEAEHGRFALRTVK